MEKELDDIEFDELLADKRHKELSVVLKAIKTLLEKPADTSTALAIEKLGGQLAKLLSEQKPTPVTVNSPDVKVEVNQEKVITSLGELSKDLLVELRKFNTRPIPSEFNIINEYGNLKTVKITYTTADKLTYKNQIDKPKYQA